jgi:hypothetical protein
MRHADNLSKYVDSHLRPFRCKTDGCSALQFSSTACLLRHEREAHGMHGHGAKPHLCEYEDCDRAIPGNGFPRRYNLYDHMKRVHHFKAPASSPPTEDDSSQKQSGSKRQNGRKRKATDAAVDNNEQPAEKKAKLKAQTKIESSDVTAAPPRRSKQDYRKRAQVQQLHDTWATRYQKLCDDVQLLGGPEDIAIHQEIYSDVAKMQQIAMKLQTLA